MSNYAERVVGRRSYGRLTQNAGTIIMRMIEPMQGAMTRITGVRVTTSTTAHILTLLRPLARTYFTADAAANQAVINIAADPGAYPSGCHTSAASATTLSNAIAGSDYVVYECADGKTYMLDTVSSVSTLALTMTTSLPFGGVKKNGLLWFFGIVTDTNPNDAQAHPRWNLLASTTTVLGRADGLTSIPDHPLLDIGGGTYQPLLLSVDNGTAASTIESVGVEYVRKAAA